LAGSGWKEYQTSGCVCSISLPEGLKEADRLPEEDVVAMTAKKYKEALHRLTEIQHIEKMEEK
jgi:phosphoribosylaminoimidazole-succinocarboxamide synthase